MSQYQAPVNDMNFLLFDVFKVQEFWANNDALSEAIDLDTAKAILEESAKVTEQAIAPFSREADETGVSWDDGTVTTPTAYKNAFNVIAEGGWIGLAGDPEFGGMGMPKTLAGMHEEMMCSADLAFALYPGLTAGACLAIHAHATEDLKNTYLPNMYAGTWAGSMCLTEAHAGTDLGLIKTKAIDNGDGSYEITGSKIFISGGEQDLTDNIVHLVLAKLPGAPEGSRGISLFIVPKFNINDDGSSGSENKVTCGSIEHKMGIHGSATCVMNFDGSKGFLVGEINKGLACMFTMMNYERLLVGLQGLGAAERSYQNALAYALDRGQGKGLPRMKEGATDPIIVHPDVRRMLLNMKAMNEGGRAFTTYVSTQLDAAKYQPDPALAKISAAKAQLLTPIAKAFVTDISLDMCIAGQQVFGGHGYVREWGQEQLVRDTRITQIYEGTNGVQALDLMGRKVAMDGGETAKLFAIEIKQFIAEQSGGFPTEMAALSDAVDDLVAVTTTVLTKAATNPNEIGAASVDYLHLFGYVMYGYMWAKMMVAVSDVEDKKLASSKIKTGRYYFQRLLPKVASLKLQIEAGAEILFSHDTDDF
ncbi:acyl-CoA dehydrogenase C-terminal domain-containing protein [Psychrosphaera sp. B3R10]|uniref:acyl-CoA dehydrogenase C-terminal domain-containing protein n=1 Tax=unclassified Psychrosphaera TaxID=2641570 RepID=UPI001C0A2BCD|nr:MULTISPECIES: acyl-CoA dehydrogenase C-terminal domain-containing protein [unclassified Psychrosphaera]MBU2880655.1 acyl-CoA dehydrogenase C-terminal domain-containing protein [Psychrosphaera sp. I2R16]MBU2990741.1 acyl-CoA dehydrogenase C-terminal domain-containing protein [Psychrosphaera sp. B3R10]